MGIGTAGGVDVALCMSPNLRLRASGVLAVLAASPGEVEGGERCERGALRGGGLGAAGAAKAWWMAARGLAAAAAVEVAAAAVGAAAMPTPLSSRTRCLFCTMNHISSSNGPYARYSMCTACAMLGLG